VKLAALNTQVRRKTLQKHNMCWTALYANKHK